MKSPSPARQTTSLSGKSRLRCEGGRDAVPHRAGARRELGRVLRELVEAMRPDREVSGAASKDRVGRQAPAEERHHLREVEVAGQRPRLEVREVVGACRLGPAAPARGLDGQQPAQPGRELGEVGDDGQVGLVDASQLARVGMDVHERLARPRHVEQRVAAGRYVPSCPPTATSRSAASTRLRERRIHADRQWAGVGARAVVDVVLAAKGRDDRDRVRLAEEDRVLARLRRPAALAHHDERPLGRRKQLPQATQLLVTWSGSRDLCRRSVGRVRLLVEHVLGQRQHHRARSACRRDRERTGDMLGDPRGVVDLGRPLRDGAEHRRVVELLERIAAGVASRHLADEEDQRRRVLVGRVHADGCVGRARAARDEADPRRPASLP